MSPGARASDAVGVVVSVVAAAVALTCASGRLVPAPAPAAPPRSAPVASAAEVPSAAPSASSAEPARADGGAAPESAGLALARFGRALFALEKQQKSEPVRVVWLGDSHTAADYMTHAVRKPLQERFGNGGPGFVQLGVEPYRHGGLKLAREGKWRREPASPAGSMKQLDSTFGLSGMRVVPESVDARVSVELLPSATRGKTSYSVIYRATGADRLRIALRGSDKSESASAKSGRAVGALRVHTLESDAPAALDIGVSGGAPELYGVLIESKTPGFVLDTLGINGARAATALAWNEAEWSLALAFRDPSLVVVAYGTNEAASTLDGARYQKNLEELVGRIKRAAPNADCLIVGPPDMAAVGGGSAPRVIEFDALAKAAAERQGCAFFSALSAMGGEGSFARWAKEKPPLAALDRVHLAPSGYERIGSAIAERLMASSKP